MNPRITAPHLALAAAVIGIWGSNFVVVKWGLDLLPPLALCTWRVLLTFVPACFLLPPPTTHWRLLICVGATMGVGQFGLLSIALQGHISPGLASVVVQTAAFFNVALAALLLREQIKRVQVQGCVLAGFGLVIIALNGGTAATEFGILLVLLTALSFAICNVLLKHSGFSGDLVGFITWSSLFATIPLAGLSLLIEGAEALMLPVSQPSVVLWLLLGEELTEWKLVAAGFIISGLAAPYASGVGALRRRRPT